MYCALLKTVFNLSVILINPFIAMQRRIIVITYILDQTINKYVN